MATTLLNPRAAAPFEIAEVVARRLVNTWFQPITSVKKRTTVGVEALSRGVNPDSGDLIPPGLLFAQAQRHGLAMSLDKICRASAIRTFTALPQDRTDLILFLNLNTATLAEDQQVAEELLRMVDRHGLEPGNVAIEVLESHIDDTTALARIVNDFRIRGFLVALDDVGAGHSNLDRIPLARPDIIKIDRSLVSGIDKDFHKHEVFKALVNLSRKIGAMVVAEGIETAPEALIALELGADLLQGFYFARPAAPDASTHDELGRRVDEVASTYKGYMVDKINQRKLQHRRFNIILNEILCELSGVAVDDFDPRLSSLVQRYPMLECAYVLNDAGIQISDTIFNNHLLKGDRRTGHLYRAAPRGADHSLKEYYYVLLDVELNKYTTEPYVSLASGTLTRTISTLFRDARNNRMFVLCIDVRAE